MRIASIPRKSVDEMRPWGLKPCATASRGRQGGIRGAYLAPAVIFFRYSIRLGMASTISSRADS